MRLMKQAVSYVALSRCFFFLSNTTCQQTILLMMNLAVIYI